MRFLHADILTKASAVYEELGFDSFSAYADFVFALVHGKWAELGFRDEAAAQAYMADLGRGVFRQPPDRAVQMALLLTAEAAA